MPTSLLDFKRTAAANLSGHRVVTLQFDGRVDYADWADSNPHEHLALTLNAAVTDATVLLLTIGAHTEPSWSWTPDAALYLGASGQLTETVPTVAGGASFLRQVGTATGTDSIFFDPQPPIALT